MSGGRLGDAALARARNGDEGAWGDIYAELSPVVLGYLRARRAQSPDDLLGEVFVQVVRDIERFDGDVGGFRAWVLTIAHHRLIDSFRRNGRRPDEEPLTEESDRNVGLAPGADEIALAQIGEATIRVALASLTEDQQAVLTLRIIGGLTVEEVARVMGKRPGAVKALQRRGLRTVRGLLEGQGVTL